VRIAPTHDTSPDLGRERLAWLDYAKGLGIILVVFGHANRAIERTSGLVWSDLLKVIDTLIYSCHMPLFFLLAGYAASLSRGSDWQSFARGTLWGIVAPYLIWSFVWIALKASLPGVANVTVEWGALGDILVSPIEHMWFLYHLLLIRFFWFGAERYLTEPMRWLAIAVAVIASIVLRGQSDESGVAAFFLENLAVYGLGLMVLPPLLETRLSWRRQLIAIVAFAALWLGLAASQGSTPAYYGILPTAIAGSCMIVMLARALPAVSNPLLKGLAALGQASLAIYVMHLVVMAADRWLLDAFGQLNEMSLLVGSTTFGLLVPLVLYRLSVAASHRMGWPLTQWFGLGPLRRAQYRMSDTAASVAKSGAPGATTTGDA
jgi:fucose 4-O-acetylase-like acetyltransferase